MCPILRFGTAEVRTQTVHLIDDGLCMYHFQNISMGGQQMLFATELEALQRSLSRCGIMWQKHSDDQSRETLNHQRIRSVEFCVISFFFLRRDCGILLSWWICLIMIILGWMLL